MEDKRTLLAFLFIGLIFLLLPYYIEWMGLTPEPLGDPQEAPVAQEKMAPHEGDDAARPPSSDPPAAAPAPESAPTPQIAAASPVVAPVPARSAFTPRDIVVRTPLQELTLSTQGGSITSCKLLNYNYIDGNTIELVPPRGRGLSIYLQRANERDDLSSIEFVADRAGLQVGPGEERTLTLVAELGGGRKLEKVLTFSGDRYGIDFELRYEGFDEDTEAILAWDQGIAFTEREPAIDLPETRAFAYINEERIEVLIDEGDSETWSDKGALKWAGIRNKYFLISYVPVDREQRTRVVLKGDRQGSQLLPDYSIEVGRRLERAGSWNNIVYIGPLEYDELVGYEAELEQAIDFGWPIVSQISRFLLILFIATHQFIPNYGWIIVLFAVVIIIRISTNWIEISISI